MSQSSTSKASSTEDPRMSELTKFLSVLASSEENSGDKQKAAKSLKSFLLRDDYEPFCRANYDKIFSVLRSLINDKVLKSQVGGLLAALSKSLKNDCGKFLRWLFPMLHQSKQIDKRVQRLSFLHDFIVIMPSPHLDAHLGPILFNLMNLVDSRNWDPLFVLVLSSIQILVENYAKKMTQYMPQLLKWICAQSTQDEPDEALQKKILAVFQKMAPILADISPQFIETILSLLKEASSIPLTLSDSKQHAQKEEKAPKPSKPSDKPSDKDKAIDDTNSANTEALALAFEMPPIPPSKPLHFLVILKLLIQSFGASLWTCPSVVSPSTGVQRPANISNSCGALLFSTFLTVAREVHHSTLVFSLRYKWDIHCNELILSLVQGLVSVNPSTQQNSQQRILMEPKQWILLSSFISDQSSTLQSMRLSKLTQWLKSYLAILNTFNKTNTGSLPLVVVHHLLNRELFALRTPAFSPSASAIVFQIISQVISLNLASDAIEWISTDLMQETKQLLTLSVLADPVTATETVPKAAAASSSFTGSKEYTVPEYKPSRTEEDKTFEKYRIDHPTLVVICQNIALLSKVTQSEQARSAVRFLVSLMPVRMLPFLDPVLQLSWIRSLCVLVPLSGWTLKHVLHESIFSVGLHHSLGFDCNRAVLQLLHELSTSASIPSSVINTPQQVKQFKSMPVLSVVHSLLDLLMDNTEALRFETSKTLAALCLHPSLLGELSLCAIRFHLVNFGCLNDHSKRVRDNHALTLARIGIQHNNYDVTDPKVIAKFISSPSIPRRILLDNSFARWSSLLRLAIGEGSPTFNKSQFSTILATIDREYLGSLVQNNSNYAEAAQSLNMINRIFQAGHMKEKMQSKWLSSLSVASTSAYGIQHESLQSVDDSGSVHSDTLPFELKFSKFFHSLVGYSSSALVSWAILESVQFAINSKLKASFNNAKEFLYHLERLLSHDIHSKTVSRHQVENPTLQARNVLYLIESLEKAIYNVVSGSLSVPTPQSSAAASFFKNNKKTCADWFIGIRGQAIKAAVRNGSPFDIIRHSYSRLAHHATFAPSQSNAVPSESLLSWKSELLNILVDLIRALLQIGDSDSLAGLLSWSRKTFGHLFLKDASNDSVSVLDLIEPNLKLCQGKLELASQQFKAALDSFALDSFSNASLNQNAFATSFLEEQNVQCLASLGEWKLLLERPNLPEVPTCLNSEMSRLFASLKCGDFEACARIATRIKSSHLIETSNPISCAYLADLTLIEASMKLKSSQGNESVAQVLRSLEQLPSKFEPALSAASSLSNTSYEIEHLVRKLHTVQLFTMYLKSPVLSPALPKSFLKTLSLPEMFQLVHLTETFTPQKEDVESRLHLASVARKTGNLNLSHRILSVPLVSQVNSLSVALEHSKLLYEKGELSEAFGLIWKSAQTFLPVSSLTTTNVLGVQNAFNIQNPSHSVLLSSSPQSKLILKLSEWLQSGRRNPEFVEIISASNSPISGLSHLANSYLEHLAFNFAPHDNKAWLAYADSCYSQALQKTKLFEVKPTEALSSAIKSRLLDQICKRDTSLFENAISQVVSKFLSTNENESIETSSIDSIQSQQNKLSSFLSNQISSLKSLIQSSIPSFDEIELDRLIEAFYIDLKAELLGFYDLSLIAYARWLSMTSTPSFSKSVDDLQISSTLRILRLLSKYGALLLSNQTKDENQIDLPKILATIPVSCWKNVIPQLISRLGHSSQFVRKQVLLILTKIGIDHPELVVYPSLVRSDVKSSTSNSSPSSIMQSSQLKLLKNSLISNHHRLVSGVESLLVEFARITTLIDERALISLKEISNDLKARVRTIVEESSRLKNQPTTVETKMQILKEKHNLVMKPLLMKFERFVKEFGSQRNINRTSIGKERNPQTTFEEPRFEKNFKNMIIPAMLKSIAAINDPRFEADVHGRIQLLSLDHLLSEIENVHLKLQKSVKRPSFSLSSTSTILSNLNGSIIPLPGYHIPIEPQWSNPGSLPDLNSPYHLTTIHSIENIVHVLQTKTRPKKIVIVGSDGNRYQYLLKGHEDLNLDERMMQFLSTINHLLKRDKQARSRELKCINYSVIPTGSRTGIIQWVDRTVPLNQIFLEHERRKITDDSTKVLKPIEMFFNKLHQKLSESGHSSSSLSRSEIPSSILESIYDELIHETPNDILSKELWVSSMSSEEHFKKIANFSKSSSTMSMIGYILGLGDRHLDNILLDFVSGDVVHIDYNVCFEGGLRLRVPETVPFRLTQNMVRALGVFGYEGTFRHSSENVLRVLRANRETLLTILEAFIYDPLVDWTYSMDKAIVQEKTLEIRVSFDIFTDRVEDLSEALVEKGKSFRKEFAQFYHAADVLFNSKKDHERMQKEYKERLATKKSLEEQKSKLSEQLSLDSNSLTKFKQSTLDLQERLAQSQATIVSDYQLLIKDFYSKISATLRDDFLSTGGLTKLQPLPQFLQSESIPRSLLTMLNSVSSILRTSTSSQAMFQVLPASMVSKANKISSEFDLVLQKNDQSIERSKKLLSTYRTIVSQLPSNYIAVDQLEQWDSVLSSCFDVIDKPGFKFNIDGKAICNDHFTRFSNFIRSKSSMTLDSTSEIQLLEEIIEKILQLHFDIKSHEAEVEEINTRITLFDSSSVDSKLQTTLEHFNDSTTSPPGLFEVSSSPETMKRNILYEHLIKSFDEYLVQLPSATTSTSLNNSSLNNSSLNNSNLNPYLDPFGSIQSASIHNSSPLKIQPKLSTIVYSSVMSFKPALEKLFTVLSRNCLVLSLESHDASFASGFNIWKPLQNIISLFASNIDNIKEWLNEMKSNAQQYSNIFIEEEETQTNIKSLLLAYTASTASSNPEIDIFGQLESILTSNISHHKNHPLVLINSFLISIYRQIIQYISLLKTEYAVGNELDFSKWQIEHLEMISQILHSPQPQVILLSHLSKLVYQFIIGEIIPCAIEITKSLIESQIVNSSRFLEFASHSQPFKTIQSKFQEILSLFEQKSKLTFEVLSLTFQRENIQNIIFEHQNQLAQIQWCNEHLFAKNDLVLDSIIKKTISSHFSSHDGSILPSNLTSSMRTNLLLDLEKSLSDLISTEESLKSVCYTYSQLESEMLKIISDKFGNAVSSPVDQSLHLIASGIELRKQSLDAISHHKSIIMSYIEVLLQFERLRSDSNSTWPPSLFLACKSFLDHLEQLQSIQPQIESLTKSISSNQQKMTILSDKILHVDSQIDVDNTVMQKLKISYQNAKQTVLQHAHHVKEYLDFERNVERDLDSLLASICTMTDKFGSKPSNYAEENASITSHPLHQIHLVSKKLFEVTKNLRTEFMMFTKPIIQLVYSYAEKGKSIPASSSSSSSSSQASNLASTSSSSSSFNPSDFDFTSSAKSTILNHKLRKELLFELDKMAQDWLVQEQEASGSQQDSLGPSNSTLSTNTSNTLSSNSLQNVHIHKTVGILHRVKEKLNGSDPILFKSNQNTSTLAAAESSTASETASQTIHTHHQKHTVEDHVSRLIVQATSRDNLSKMYEGWTAWI